MVLRRYNNDLTPNDNYFKFLLYELRLYTTPNLLILQKGEATIKAEVMTDLSYWDDLNLLIDEPGLGNSRHDYLPRINAQNERATKSQCFVIPKELYEATGGKITFTVDLGDSFFIHALVLVQSWDEYSFGPYEVYVGDDSDFKMNSKCPGGPHQDKQSSRAY